MKTIQMTIDESLLSEVDRATQALGTTRSEFIREALHLALQRMKISTMERKHQAGYTQKPVAPGEFDVWESEQVWS